MDNREVNWAKSWSKWANKSRKEVIEMTDHLKTLYELEQKMKWLRKTRGWYRGIF